MPVVSASVIHKLNGDGIADPFILLIELEEEYSGIVHRFCNDNGDILSNGETYVPFAIDFALPAKGEEQTPVNVSVSNVDREPGKALLSADSRVMFRMMVIDAADPDAYIMDTLDMFFLSDSTISAQLADGTVAPVIDWQTPTPFFKTTQNLFPGVWV